MSTQTSHHVQRRTEKKILITVKQIDQFTCLKRYYEHVQPL